jgi:hypothetical protein
MKQLRLALTSITLLAAALLHAHPATERYIPIGRSSATTIEGTISSRGTDPYRLTIDAAGRETTVVVNEQTRIWIDRHHLEQTSVSGSYADCAPGRHVEVKRLEADPGVADWIKVRGG